MFSPKYLNLGMRSTHFAGNYIEFYWRNVLTSCGGVEWWREGASSPVAFTLEHACLSTYGCRVWQLRYELGGHCS